MTINNDKKTIELARLHNVSLTDAENLVRDFRASFLFIRGLCSSMPFADKYVSVTQEECMREARKEAADALTKANAWLEQHGKE